MSNLSNETTEEQLVHILNYYEVDSFSDVKREILNLINSEALKLLDRLESECELCSGSGMVDCYESGEKYADSIKEPCDDTIHQAIKEERKRYE